ILAWTDHVPRRNSVTDHMSSRYSTRTLIVTSPLRLSLNYNCLISNAPGRRQTRWRALGTRFALANGGTKAREREMLRITNVRRQPRLELEDGAAIEREGEMLRITVQDSPQSVALKLEGQLKGPWVEETERVWKNCDRPVAVVDLCDVTSVDLQGKDLLAKMYQGGANLVAYTPMMTNIIEVLTRNDKAPGKALSNAGCTARASGRGGFEARAAGETLGRRYVRRVQQQPQDGR